MVEISKDEIEHYHRDGVVCLRDMFDRCWLELLAEATEDALRSPGPHSERYGEGSFFGDLDLWQRNDRFRAFVMDSTAAEIAAKMMCSSTATFFYDQLLVKEVGSAEVTPWHQDQPYWAVRGRQVCSIWVPLDPVSADSSLEYVRGSHHWEEFNPSHFNDHSPYGGTGLPRLPNIESSRDGYDIARYPLELGDCLVFQAMIVHGAPGNKSLKHRRRAYSTRWLGDDARYHRRKGEVAIPTFSTAFADGDRYGGEMFPTVWPRDQY